MALLRLFARNAGNRHLVAVEPTVVRRLKRAVRFCHVGRTTALRHYGPDVEQT